MYENIYIYVYENIYKYICVCVSVCVYVCVCREMVDFGKSDKMIKISGKVNKPTLTTDLVIFRSLLERELHQNEN